MFAIAQLFEESIVGVCLKPAWLDVGLRECREAHVGPSDCMLVFGEQQCGDNEDVCVFACVVRGISSAGGASCSSDHMFVFCELK